MKLWILKPIFVSGNDPWKPWYDKTFGFIVRAETEEDARAIANENGGEECGPIGTDPYRTGGDPWLSAEFSTCEELSRGGDAEVLMSDYRSA